MAEVDEGSKQNPVFGPVMEDCGLRGIAKDVVDLTEQAACKVAGRVEKESRGTRGEEMCRRAEKVAKEVERWIQAVNKYTVEDGLHYDGDGEDIRTLCIPEARALEWPYSGKSMTH